MDKNLNSDEKIVFESFSQSLANGIEYLGYSAIIQLIAGFVIAFITAESILSLAGETSVLAIYSGVQSTLWSIVIAVIVLVIIFYILLIRIIKVLKSGIKKNSFSG